MALSQNRRAYLRAVPGLPIQTQRRMAEDAGCGETYEFGSLPGYDMRREWVRSLRPGDVAWVPRLDVIAHPAQFREIRASADLSATVAQILGAGAVIEDGATGVSSRDGDRWRERFEAALARVAAGSLTPAEAKRRGRKGGQVRSERGVATRWLSPGMDAERERWASVWRDPIHRNDEAAAAAIDVPELRGRKWLCRQIFGGRRPGDNRAGGRPPRKTE